MKTLIAFLLLSLSTQATEYYKVKVGTCLQMKDSTLSNLVIKSIYNDQLLVMQYKTDDPKKVLHNLMEDTFNKEYYDVVECPSFNAINSGTFQNLKEMDEVESLMQAVNWKK